MNPFAVYSKQLSSVSDFVSRRPWTRDAQCETKAEARIIVKRLEADHPARHFFAGINVGPTYSPPTFWADHLPD